MNEEKNLLAGKKAPVRAVGADALNKLAELTKRYSGATPEALAAVLCPLLIAIDTIDKTIIKVPGQSHHRASFTIKVTAENRVVVQRGRTGKFVPASYERGGIWREIAKGRIIEVDEIAGIAKGEVYTGARRADLEVALGVLQPKDYWEVDQFGAAAKVLSGLTEYYLVELATGWGYSVRRMPEDMARHLGSYANYDFEFEKLGKRLKVEVKSLWGTNTKFARLIHSLTSRPGGAPQGWTPEQQRNYYPTSSCKFETQDIFAVSLFLASGNIRDFAFARSVPTDVKPYGLPRAEKFPEHVNQNPPCAVGDGTWFSSLDEVWDLE